MPVFERTSGSTLTIVSGGSVAGAADSIPDRLQRGEPADVVIMAAAGIDELVEGGRVAAGGRVDLARSGIGVAIAPARHSRTSARWTRSARIAAATSVAYSGSVSGVYVSSELFERLGIAAEMRPRAARWTASRLARSSPAGRRSWASSRSASCGRSRRRGGRPAPRTVQRVTIFPQPPRALPPTPAAAGADRVPVVSGRRIRRDRQERHGPVRYLTSCQSRRGPSSSQPQPLLLI